MRSFHPARPNPSSSENQSLPCCPKHPPVIVSTLVAIAFLLPGCRQEPSTSVDESTAAHSSKVEFKSNEFPIANSVRQLSRNKFESADIRILFVGNSHTRTSPSFLGQLLIKNDPETKVVIARSMGGFLVEHMTNENTLSLIDYGKWDYVILQAQKYSTSGKFVYSMDGAISLATRAQSKGAKVIMFPEWSRRGVPEEHKRIDKIHDKIAELTGATVAPIGQCWVKVAEAVPELELYHADGNHASKDGHFVNACIFHQMIAKDSDKFSTIEFSSPPEFSHPIEQKIYEIVSESVQQ